MGIAVRDFVAKVMEIVAEEPEYQLGHDGTHGKCDCIGLPIGGKRRAGGSWRGIHGTNYAVRAELVGGIQRIVGSGDLQIGEVVFKARKPTDAKYALPDRYKPGGEYYNGDLLDYYHVGVVVSVHPMRIWHMTTPKPKLNNSIANWGWHGRLKGIDYVWIRNTDEKEVRKMATAIVALPAMARGNDVNLREGPGRNYGIKMHVPVGAEVQVIEDQGQWCQIGYGNVTGWMMANYLEYPGQAGEASGEGLSIEDHTKIDRALSEAEAMLIQIQEKLETIGSIVGRG